MARHRRTRIERGIFTEHRPTGDVLVVRWYADGDRSQVQPRGTTIEQARRELARLEASARPTPASARPSAMTLRDYALRWIEGKASAVRRSTAEQYISVIAARLLPAVVRHAGRAVQLGDVPAREVTRDHAVAWVTWATQQTSRRGRPYAHATLDGWWRPIRCLLADMAADLDMSDPTRRVRGPRSDVRDVRETETLTAAQLGRLVDTIERKYQQWHAEVLALALLGLRPGALYEMRWSDIDRDRGVVLLSRAHWRGTVGPTKTGKARVLAIAPALQAALTAHWWRQMRAGCPAGPADLVFPASTGGHRGTESVYKVLRMAAIEAGLEVRVGPQVLRRTFNTLAIERGASPIVVRSQMGHSSARMTHRYAGVHDEAKRAVVDDLAQAIKPRRRVKLRRRKRTRSHPMKA